MSSQEIRDLASLVFGIICTVVYVVLYCRSVNAMRFKMSERPITRNQHIEELKRRVYGDHKRRSRT